MAITTTLDHRDLPSGDYVIRQTRHSKWRGIVTINWKRFQVLVDDRRGRDVWSLSSDGWGRALSDALGARIVGTEELQLLGGVERLGTVEYTHILGHVVRLQIARIVERDY